MMAGLATLGVLAISRPARCPLDMSDCFSFSKPDFSSVSETEGKHKNARGSLDRDRGVWDIQFTRRTLIES
jgi:hypothetical protein